MKRDQLPAHIREKCPEGLTDEQIEAWLLGYLASSDSNDSFETTQISDTNTDTVNNQGDNVIKATGHDNAGIKNDLGENVTVEKVISPSQKAVSKSRIRHWGSSAGFVIGGLHLIAFMGNVGKSMQGEGTLSPVGSLISGLITILGSGAYRSMKMRRLTGAHSWSLVFEFLVMFGILIYSFYMVDHSRPLRMGLFHAGWCLAAFVSGLFIFERNYRTNPNTAEGKVNDPWRGQKK